MAKEPKRPFKIISIIPAFLLWLGFAAIYFFLSALNLPDDHIAIILLLPAIIILVISVIIDEKLELTSCTPVFFFLIFGGTFLLFSHAYFRIDLVGYALGMIGGP